jgi:hypothetical protein
MQKLASVLANKFVDSVALNTEPPIVYDGNDPYMVQNDGPIIAPGVKTPSKGSNAFQEIKVGDPTMALQGLEMTIRQLQGGTGVSDVRSAVPTADRQTAFEVNKVAQAGEVRTVDFIRKLNRNLQTWLYMQHALNIKYLKEYSFYNDDMRSKDFVRVTDKDLKQYAETAHFDVVGARGILGEEQRSEKMGLVTAFASQNPLFAPLLKPQDLLLEAYRDAGVKNPERFVNQEQDMVPQAAVDQAVQEATMPLQEELAKTQEALTKAQMGEQAKVIEAQTKREAEMARVQQDEMKIVMAHEAEMERIHLAHQARLIEIGAQKEAAESAAKIKAESGPDTKVSVNVNDEEQNKKVMANVSTEMEKAVKQVKDMIDNMPKPSKRKKVTAPSGRQYVVEDD